ncbi:hypothetical protein [Microbulbifer sp. PSTR4-B]|uniref:hypothetical protein n=1 Tax=unclassified Microbulbifer TaxID=2619833 RepID=UPI00403AC3E8
MSLKGSSDRAFKSLAAQRDRILRNALSRALGRDDWQEEELAGRCSLQASPARDLYLLDGEPLVEFYTAEAETQDLWPTGGYSLTALQHYRLLTDPPEQ